MKIIGLLMLLSGAAMADRLEYLGRDKGTGAAQVQHAQGKQSVQEGDEIPGWGRVQHVDDEALHLVRKLTDAEKEARRAKGQVPADDQELIVPRSDLQTVPVTPPAD